LAVTNILEKAREKFQTIVDDNHLTDEEVLIKIGTLTPEQAIGTPSRNDYALLDGKEVMIEARFKDSFGQAFTDQPVGFKGTIRDVLALNLDAKGKRAIFISTLNSVMAHLGMANGFRHCRDQEPEECAHQIAEYILKHYGKIKIGLIGLQPAILENLVRTFGPENISCTDLNTKNIGLSKYGPEILDGRTETPRLIRWGDILLVTSSTLVNNSFDSIFDYAFKLGKPIIIFGVSGAGISVLLGFERVCFSAH
jgi:hypothetical protein